MCILLLIFSSGFPSSFLSSSSSSAPRTHPSYFRIFVLCPHSQTLTLNSSFLILVPCLPKLLKGLVKHSSLGTIPDLVSAPHMAKELGIDSSISTEAPANSSTTPYWNLLSAKVRVRVRINVKVFDRLNCGLLLFLLLID